MSDDIQTYLHTLAAFPDQLKRQVHGLDDIALRFRPAPSEWSAVEVVGHLIDIEAVYSGRIRQALTTERPNFPAFAPDDAVRQRDYQNKQINFLLISFAERRSEHLEFLRMLRPGQIARTGVHPSRGPVSVADLIRLLSEHDENHRNQIANNLAALAGGKAV